MFNENTKFYVCDLIREKLNNRNTHVGKSLSELKDEYKNHEFLDFKYFNKNYWWVDFDDEKYHLDYGYESWENFDSRIFMFLLFVCTLDQKSILIVSHSKIGKYLLGKKEKQKVSQETIYLVNNKFITEKIKKFISTLK